MRVKITEPIEGDFTLRPQLRTKVIDIPDGSTLHANAVMTDEPLTEGGTQNSDSQPA